MASDFQDGHDLVKVKRVPMRRNGALTQDAILNSAAQLLQDVGFERLSTNMICAHAGITPPALYRYFPNKYAVLFGLAHALLIRQHEGLKTWLAEGGFDWTTTEEGISRINTLLIRLRGIADAQVGAIWIMRAIRSVPMLTEVRRIAQRKMLDDLLSGVRKHHPDLSSAQLEIPTRLVNEIIHMSTELEMDDPALDANRLRRGIALAIVSYLAAI